MLKNISVCIIGKDNDEFLQECIDSCTKFCQNVNYIDMGSHDNSLKVATKNGLKAKTIEPFLESADKLLDEFCLAEWVLFLRADERLAFRPDAQLEKTLEHKSVEGYSLVVKKVIEPKVLEKYEWIKANTLFKYFGNNVYVPSIEIRLVREQYFNKFLKLMTTWSTEHIFQFDSQILNDLEIISCKYEKPKENDPAEIKEREIKFIKGEISLNPDESDDLAELGDDYVIFSVITKEDLKGYYKGLSMGFGSERMYLTMIHYLARFGNFSDAKDFFEAWEEKQGDFDTAAPYRIGGIIYTSIFSLDKAVSCFEKYIELTTDKELLIETSSSLAKAYLLKGLKHKAIPLLKHSIKSSYNEFDKILYQSITRDNWHPLQLTVCIIARDEDQNIGRALESASDVADEIIVIDTGSSDNTKEIAKRFNAKVIDFIWENDFSKARNLGLKESSCDYILFLDADEFIDPRDRINLALVKQILPPERDVAFMVNVESEEEDEEIAVMLRLPKIAETDYPVRLLPSHKEICFQGTAFENPYNSLNSLGIKIEHNNMFKITHGNTDRQLRDRRKEIAVSNAFDSISDPKLALKGSIYFFRLGEQETAVKWLKKADIDNPLLLAKIIELYSKAGKAGSLIPIINKAAERFPESMELRLVKAEIRLSDGKYEKVCDLISPYMETIKETLSRADFAKASYIYGMALMEKGDIKRGIKCLIDSRENDSWNTKYKMGGIYALTKFGEWEKAIEAVTDLLRGEKLKINLTIDDFGSMGVLFAKLYKHLLYKKNMESADLCFRIVEDIVENRVSNKAEIEKITEFLKPSDELMEGSIND